MMMLWVFIRLEPETLPLTGNLWQYVLYFVLHHSWSSYTSDNVFVLLFLLTPGWGRLETKPPVIFSRTLRFCYATSSPGSHLPFSNLQNTTFLIIYILGRDSDGYVNKHKNPPSKYVNLRWSLPRLLFSFFYFLPCSHPPIFRIRKVGSRQKDGRT